MSQPCPILLINLKGSTDRLATARSELRRAGADAERVEAVDGRQIDPAERARIAPWRPEAFFQALSPGEIGCYLSHLSAAEQVVRLGWPWAVVMEDDFRLGEAFLPRLSGLVRGFPEGREPDLVKLEGKMDGGAVLGRLDAGVQVLRYRRPAVRTVALLWSQAGARKFLGVARPLRRPVDVQMKHWWEGDLDILAVRPQLVLQDRDLAGASTIGSRRTRGLSMRLRKIAYHLRYSLEARRQFIRRHGRAHWREAVHGSPA